MEKRIRALKAIILVVVMIVELFGVDAVRVVAETINVTGDTTISTEDNRDYAVTDCTLTVSSTGNITGTVYGSGGKIVNQGSIRKIERNIEVDNQAGASIQDLQSSVGITNAGHITSATYSSTYTLTNSGTIDTLNVQNPGYSGSTATVNMNAGTISSLNVTNYSGMNPVINYAGGTITSLIAEGTNGADLVVSGSHEISQLKGTVNVSGSGMLTVSGALQLEKGYTGEKLGVTKDTALTVKDGYTVQVNYKDHVYSISSATEQKITDLAGNTVSAVMDDAAAATMTVETPFTSETYMYGEQAVAVYLAKDDYYFPEDYQATVTGGSGTLDITRVNAKEIKLAYTFADEKKNIQISLPAANARGTQDAPAGLDGGVKKVTGVTEDMEYAVSETSETWTQVTGITDSGTLAMEPGTWYFRYKETDEKKVSAATKVIVKGEGVASVEQGDVNYGTKPDPKAETSTNTEKTAVIEYKEASSDDTAYSQTVPTAVGNYTVRATFAETEAYGEAVATTDFSIRYLETPEPPYTLVGTKGENGYYTSNVVVKPAKGYMISTELNGTYVESLTIQNSQSGTVFYLRNASGERTGALRLETIKIKKQTPKLSLENGKTYYGDSQKLVIQDDYLSQVYVNGVLQNLDGTEFVLQLGSNNGKKKYEITAVDVAGNKKTILVTVAAAWMKTGIIPEGVLVNLETGNGYKLGNGNWKVAGDSTSYSGGTEFYVKKDGSYTFGKQ
jgi:cell wall/surface repeat protein